MGLFQGEREVTVDSVIYNMAGPEEGRPNYLRSLTVGNILSGSRDSLADSYQRGYLNGPSMKFRQFYRWAQDPDNFDKIGFPTGELLSNSAVNTAAVQEVITDLTGHSVWVQRAEIGMANYGRWVEQWLLVNNPVAMNTAWTADISSDGSLITITYADLSTASFAPADFEPGSQYIYAWHTTTDPTNASPIVTGTTIELGTDPFPSISGWTYEGTSSVGDETTWTYSRMTYVGIHEDGSEYLREIMYLHEDASPLDRNYRIDQQEVVGLTFQTVRLFIYRIGSGSEALDSLVSTSSPLEQFFPFLPVRINNTFLSEDYYPEAYAQVRKAYKKLTGSRYEDYIEKLEDNENLSDIDYSYITFGVSLNVKENSCKRYLYSFFEKLQLSQIGGPGIYAFWKANMETQQIEFADWFNWKQAQDDPESFLYGTQEPPRPVFPTMSTNVLKVAGNNVHIPTNYDTRLAWHYVANGSGFGLGKPGAKVGELWFESLPPDEFFAGAYGGEVLGQANGEASDISMDRTRLYWQRTANSYTYLDVVGLTHFNYIYGYKGLMVTASNALGDEDESAFVIPLHFDTWREVSLVHSSQMATACVFSVFNCYEVRKQKWYQSGIFSIIAVIVIAILSVIFTGGAGIGLLGAHMAIGSLLGLSGMAAAIVGSVINAFAALVLTAMLQQVTTGLFGEALGSLVSSVIMLVLGSFSFSNGTAFFAGWEHLLRVDNLIALTNAAGRAFTGMINEGTQGIGEAMRDYADNAQKEAEKIQQAFYDQFGYGTYKIDPLMLTAGTSTSRIFAESSDTFLSRTLMTGSEIAELSHDLINNFQDYSLNLPTAFV